MTRRLLLSYLSITAFVLLILEIPLALTYEHSERDRLAADVERDAARARDARRGHPGGPDTGGHAAARGRVSANGRRPGRDREPGGSERRRLGSRPPRATSPRGPSSRTCSPPATSRPGPATRTPSTSPCCTSRCRSRRRARCSARCASRSPRPSSTCGSTATGSPLPRSVASSWSRSPASASCWRVR